MCQLFSCPDCWYQFFDRCQHTAFESASPCSNTIRVRDRFCQSCELVKGVITRLATLILQVPFLETKGMVGLDDIHGWQKEEFENVLRKKKGQSDGWEDKAELNTERHILVDKMQSMGLDCMVDGRDEFLAFEPISTPETKSEKDFETKKIEEGITTNKENILPQRS